MILTMDRGPVRELRLNRPPVNALTSELLLALREAIEQAPHDGGMMTPEHMMTSELDANRPAAHNATMVPRPRGTRLLDRTNI